MTDKEIVLAVLGDRNPHLVEEIEAVAFLRGKSRITVHSRVSDLRNMGYEIRSFKIGNKPGYQLIEKKEGIQRVVPRVVQGYMFQSVAETGELSKRNDTVCQIVRRTQPGVDSTDKDVLAFGPSFVVRFGDGYEDVAYSTELNPWYPV